MKCHEKINFFVQILLPVLAKRVETSWGSCKSKFNYVTQRPSRFRIQTSRYEKAKPRFLHRKPANHPRIRLRRILELCAFAEKNAVFLTNQGCKGGKSVGRNDRLWHPKSPSLLKPSSPSHRIRLTLNSVIRMPISNKEGTAYGGPGALWHLKPCLT